MSCVLQYGSFHQLKHPNPFIDAEDDAEEIASVAYRLEELVALVIVHFFDLFSLSLSARYRKFYLKDGVGMVVRCEHDSALPPSDPKGEPEVFINIKALNEWDPKVSTTC